MLDIFIFFNILAFGSSSHSLLTSADLLPLYLAESINILPILDSTWNIDLHMSTLFQCLWKTDVLSHKQNHFGAKKHESMLSCLCTELIMMQYLGSIVCSTNKVDPKFLHRLKTQSIYCFLCKNAIKLLISSSTLSISHK